MIARMPELSLSETSARLKPSRLSISSWLRMRSAPPLALCMKLEPSSTMAAHCEAAASGLSPAPFGGGALLRARRIGLEREAPFGGERVLVDLVSTEAHGRRSSMSCYCRPVHWTTISLNSTALTRFGLIAALTRRVNSSFRR